MVYFRSGFLCKQGLRLLGWHKMTFIIPKTTRLFGIEPVTKFIKNLARDHCKNGQYLNQSRVIEISKDLNDQEQFGTFIHEVVECIVINLEMETEHSDITRFGTAFTQFMLDNEDRMVE